MFCCTKPSHEGQIVTTVCLDQNCHSDQLACSVCASQNHKNHNTTSLKRLLPDLLKVHSSNINNNGKLQRLMKTIRQEFGQQNEQDLALTQQTCIQRTIQLLLSMKRQLQTTRVQIEKIKPIIKNLNKQSPSKYLSHSPSKIESNMSSVITQKQNKSSYNSSPAFNKNQQSHILGHDVFSQNLKHSYISLSNQQRTATRVSATGHRLVVLGSRNVAGGEEVRIRVQRSGGNIMIGLCMQSFIRQKQFSNCYGMGSGTYLIGQNGNAVSAITFHHSINLINRKQIVGWNFTVDDEIVLSYLPDEDMIVFKREGKRATQEYTMRIIGSQTNSQILKQNSQGLRLIVMLQAEGDQVSTIEQD